MSDDKDEPRRKSRRVADLLYEVCETIEFCGSYGKCPYCHLRVHRLSCALKNGLVLYREMVAE